MAAATFQGEDAEDNEQSLESEFFDLLIASERVSVLIDRIKDASCFQRRRQAVFDLAAAVDKKESFVVEARQAGAVDLLTSMLKKYSDDEELMSKACKIITACSGTLSCSGKVQDFKYGPVSVTVREGTLAEGLGARIWAIAHSLCRLLVENTRLVEGKKILEIGAGTGLCGIVAAKLGAAQVTLTDYEVPVLHILRESVAANASCVSAVGCCPLDAGPLSTTGFEAESLEFDPEDAEECDNLDDFLHGGAVASESLYWDLDNMRVRHMDWNDEESRLKGTACLNGCKGPVKNGFDEVVPMLDASETFDVILGSDILYEMAHASLVAAVLSRRLCKGGTALISIAVRDQAILDTFLSLVEGMQLSAEVKRVEASEEHRGILGLERDYEGGFVIITILHPSK